VTTSPPVQSTESTAPATIRVAPRTPSVDAHIHVFCWGENPAEGYFSATVRRSWLTRVVMRLLKINREKGATISDKIRSMLFRHLENSSLDHAVLFAQDQIYRHDGTVDATATPFYVSNDYVLRLAKEHRKIIPCASINPWRTDALAELDRIREAGCRLVKIHTAIQGVDPSLARFEPFYERARELSVMLIFHTGYEHSAPVVSQLFTDPARLARPLDQGVPLIAAHCGTCAFFDPENYYNSFVAMMKRYPNLYGDTAIMASTIRWSALARLEAEPAWLRARLVHGSDYPLPPGRVAHLHRTGLFPGARGNPMEMDLRVKRAYEFGPDYECQMLNLIGDPVTA
jgi:hypothetical protein